jgi:hypothetical protein
MNNKITKIIILVLIIIALVLVTAKFIFWKNLSLSNKTDGNNIATSSIEKPATLEYINNQYGFSFSLPTSWEGFTILSETWSGYEVGDQGDKKYTEGPLISIRHPLWTEKIPRQDIPVMIFTISQWQDLQDDKFHIGAAPIGPSELGRNAGYVFALPARYNYAFPLGYEEVDEIIKNNSFQAF